MTIDKLIKALEGEREFGDVWIDDEDARVIVALLKAGQELADKAGALLTLTDHDWGYYHKDLSNAIEAWDAAVKGDV